MKHTSLFILLALVAGTFAGCQTTSGMGTTSCGCLQANCCGWDFYKKCDLIEGKAERICGETGCQPGVIASRCYAVREMAPAAPMAPPAPAPVQIVPPETPPPAAAVIEVPAPGAPADEPIGFPPAGR